MNCYQCVLNNNNDNDNDSNKTIFIRLTALALITLLDLERGLLFEVGAYQIFTIFSKCSMFILQQNNKW